MRSFEKFMGPDFNEQPLPTYEELEQEKVRLKKLIERHKKKGHGLGALKFDMNALNNVLYSQKNGLYILTKEEANYRKEYDQKCREYEALVQSELDQDELSLIAY
jgi:hypothetical protein